MLLYYYIIIAYYIIQTRYPQMSGENKITICDSVGVYAHNHVNMQRSDIYPHLTKNGFDKK